MASPKKVTKELLDESLRQELESKLNKSDAVDWSQIQNKPQLADNSWKPPVETPADLPLEGNEDGDIRLTLDTEKYVFTWSDEYEQWFLIGANDTSVDWGHIQNKPTTFSPEQHEHYESDIVDLDKYTKQEVDTRLSMKADVEHTHQYANEEHEHTEHDIIDLDKYTKQEVDSKLLFKANKVHKHPLGDVEGLQSALDEKVDVVLGKQLSTNDFTDEAKRKLESLSNDAEIDYNTMYTRLDERERNYTIHITDAERKRWDGKADNTAHEGHVNNHDIHVTRSDKERWNSGMVLSVAEPQNSVPSMMWLHVKDTHTMEEAGISIRNAETSTDEIPDKTKFWFDH